ncbi:MAG TPA: hypothetical protein VFX06_11580 [Stellaceae bacterium]|nr:hypothetical protein [Stellaceae bacterium]
MTLAEAGEIFAYWQENPPAHLLLQAIARLFGWNPAVAPSISEIAAAAPPGVVLSRGGIDMPRPLDAAALAVRNRARVRAPLEIPPSFEVTHGR